MAIFSNSTARADSPRTVTYNAEPISEAMHRSARIGSRVIAQTLGVAAWLLAAVALLMAWSFAASLAVTWGEIVKLCAVATGLVAAMVGLPVASALMSRSYPQESRWAVRAWLVALGAVSLAAMVFTWRLETPEDKGGAGRLLAQPLASPAVRSAFMRPDIWQGTDGCTRMRNLYDEMVCEEYSHRKLVTGTVELLADAAPDDWSPAGLLGVTSIAEGAARQGLVLILMLMATGGAGVFGRWAVLATAESYRLGEGMASAPPSMPLPAAPVPVGPAGNIIGPLEAFDMWASGRLSYDAGGEVTGDAAYQDYAETCRLNNLQAVSPAKFGGLLTRLADSSQGRVMKVKSNGQMRYRGVRLPDGVVAGSTGYGSVH